MNRLAPPCLVLLAAALAAPRARAGEAHVKIRTVEIVAGDEETTDPAIEPDVAEALRKFYGQHFGGRKLALTQRGSREDTGPADTEVKIHWAGFVLTAAVVSVDEEAERVALRLTCTRQTDDGGEERLWTYRCSLKRGTVFPVEVPEERRADRTVTWAVTAEPK